MCLQVFFYTTLCKDKYTGVFSGRILMKVLPWFFYYVIVDVRRHLFIRTLLWGPCVEKGYRSGKVLRVLGGYRVPYLCLHILWTLNFFFFFLLRYYTPMKLWRFIEPGTWDCRLKSYSGGRLKSYSLKSYSRGGHPLRLLPSVIRTHPCPPYTH